MFRKLYFNLWYYLNPPWDTGISPPELIDYIAHHSPGCALDLGCGSGTNVITLAQSGWQATGIDFSHRAISYARKKAKKSRVKVDLLVGDVTRLDNLQGPFDLILDIGCFHSLPAEGKNKYLIHLERLLAPDGTFLMYGFFKEPGESGPGLLETDINQLTSTLYLNNRQDGTERSRRLSAWFTFKKPK